jgi:hypothetical protein
MHWSGQQPFHDMINNILNLEPLRQLTLLQQFTYLLAEMQSLTIIFTPVPSHLLRQDHYPCARSCSLLSQLVQRRALSISL